MTYLLENLWVWTLAAIVAVGIGFYIFTEKRSLKVLGGAAAVALLLLFVGVTLVYFVPTQRKSIASVLNQMAEAITANNAEGVKSHISPKATGLRSLADRGLQMFTVEKANFSDLKIEVNEHMTPVTATVSFTGTFHWRFRLTGEGPQIGMVKFQVEMEQTQDSWILTGKYKTDKLNSLL